MGLWAYPHLCEGGQYMWLPDKGLLSGEGKRAPLGVLHTLATCHACRCTGSTSTVTWLNVMTSPAGFLVASAVLLLPCMMIFVCRVWRRCVP